MSFLCTRLDLPSTALQTQWMPCSCWQWRSVRKGTREEDREGGREGGREGRGREGRRANYEAQLPCRSHIMHGSKATGE